MVRNYKKSKPYEEPIYFLTLRFFFSVRSYVVVDHCPRNLVQLQTEGLNQLPVKLNTSSDMSGKLLMLLTMLENHERKTVEMVRKNHHSKKKFFF